MCSYSEVVETKLTLRSNRCCEIHGGLDWLEAQILPVSIVFLEIVLALRRSLSPFL